MQSNPLTFNSTYPVDLFFNNFNWSFYQQNPLSSHWANNELPLTFQWASSELPLTFQWASTDPPMSFYWATTDLPMSFYWASTDLPIIFYCATTDLPMSFYWATTDLPVTLYLASDDLPLSCQWIPFNFKWDTLREINFLGRHNVSATKLLENAPFMMGTMYLLRANVGQYKTHWVF